MKIGLVDLNTGNLTSLQSALNKLNLRFKICKNGFDFQGVDKIILPGVGAFGAMMEKLNEGNFSLEIINHISQGKPFMGICLGMQILFEFSTEFGRTPGLGILKGSVHKLPLGSEGVPNVGWRTVCGSYFQFSQNINSLDTFYFVHSYVCKPTQAYDTLEIKFNSEAAVVAVKHNNVIGYQFHPEKSQNSGQKLLRSFLES